MYTEELFGDLIVPNSLNKSSFAELTCIVFVHGLMCNRKTPILSSIVDNLCTEVSCFLFDFPGQGDSSGIFEFGM